MKNKGVYFLPYQHFNGKIAATKNMKSVVSFFTSHFQCSSAVLTSNGRAAISLLLERLKLSRKDEVYITTTFDFPNVSSCVTCTVFNYCKPSRVLTRNTRAVVVIHEFGVPHRRMDVLAALCRRRKMPLIEDCAHTISSFSGSRQVGTWGDWVICSLPKIFPVKDGGVLLSRRHVKNLRCACGETALYVAPFLNHLDEISQNRRNAYSKMTEYASAAGLKPLFEISKKITPWYFSVRVPDVRAMMGAASKAGVECALWHGTNVVVFPCHQYLTENHLKHVGEVMKKGLESGRDY